MSSEREREQQRRQAAANPNRTQHPDGQQDRDMDMLDAPPPQPRPHPQPHSQSSRPQSSQHQRRRQQQQQQQPQQLQRQSEPDTPQTQANQVGSDKEAPPQPQVAPPPPAVAEEKEEEEYDEDERVGDEEPAQNRPPPPPPAPGPRAARLQALFATTARHTLDKISRDNFAACFPTIAARAPGTLEFVQRQMVERLGGLWKKEFDTILANRQVVARLNELETLVSDAAARRRDAGEAAEPPVAPHTLPADIVLAAHLRPHLAEQRSQLAARLRDTQAANAQLWDEVSAQRAEMEALLASVERALRDVDGAGAVLAGVLDELAEETRAADAEVRAALSAAAGGNGNEGGGGGVR